MSLDIKVPAAGESITSANVARWHKKNGDAVRKGDTLVTLETDKVSNELEADGDGTLQILVNEGEEVSIGTVIGRIAIGASPADASVAPKLTPEASPEGSAPATSVQAATVTPADKVVELKVPAAGESITSANVAAWRKSDGDIVAKGEILVALDTDKVSNELEAPVAGRLKILVPQGEEVAIGAVIATIEADVSASAKTPVSSPAPAATPASASVPAPVPAAPSAIAKPAAPVEPAPRLKPDLTVVPSPVE
ncbi:MAG TPA: biotin/lipoyl-containing protein, partial [Luteolibacter sp.]